MKIKGKSLLDILSEIENKSKKVGFEFAREASTATNKDGKRNADYCVSFDHKSYEFSIDNNELIYTLDLSNCVSFKNIRNYNFPNSQYEVWDNNWSWDYDYIDLTNSNCPLKAPAHKETSLNLFYQIRNRIVDALYENKFPDSVTFDIAIRGLLN